MYVDRFYWTLSDTAGLRITNDVIEAEGIERSWHEAAQADLVLIIIDSSIPLTSSQHDTYFKLLSTYHDKALVVYTKADLRTSQELVFIDASISMRVSIHNQQSIDQLMVHMKDMVNKRYAHGTSFTLNMRQAAAITTINTYVQHAIDELTHGAYELVTIHITDALATCADVTGKTVTEETMNAIFKEFCVGK